MKQTTLLILLLALSPLWGLGQNGLLGEGFGTDDWGTTDDFSGSAGSSRIGQFTANATGNQYFRLVTNWDGNYNQWGPSSTESDYTVTIGTPVPASEIVENSTTKAYLINVSNSSYNYIFKTKSGGNPPSDIGLVVFEVQGTVRSVSSVSQSPAKGSVSPSDAVTVTATMDSTLASGQGVYLRYTNDNWSTSSVLEMSFVSGNDYSVDIPGSANTSGKVINYYVFTSGDGLSIAHATADWYTINLNNNGGTNYTYSLPYGTAQAGNWSEGTTWGTGSVPQAGDPVEIAHDVTLDQDATVGDFSIASGATFTASDGNERTLSVNDLGGFDNNGTFTGADGIVHFLGVTNVSGTIVFNDVIISGGVNFGTSSTVNGKLTIATGGYVNTSCPAYGPESILEYTSNYGAAAEWDNVPNSVSVAGSGITVTFDKTKALNGNLTIGSGNTFTVSSEGALSVDGEITVNGTLTNEGDVILTSTGLAVGQTATLVGKDGSVTGTGTFTAERYITADRWFYTSPAVSDASSSVFSPEGSSGDDRLFTWNEANSGTIDIGDGWQEISDGTTDLNPLQSYAFIKQSTGDVTLSFSGSLNDDPAALTLSRTTNAAKEGFHLVGNPFATYVDLTSDDVTRTNLEPTAWFRSSGGFEAVNMTSGDTESSIATQYAAPQQGFWVRVSEGATGTFDVDKAAQVSQSVVGSQAFLKTTVRHPHLLRLAITSGAQKDETAIGFYSAGTPLYDSYDSKKLFADDPSLLQLYTEGETGALAIHSLPATAPDNQLVPLGVRLPKAGTYTLSAEQIAHFQAAPEVYLEDKERNELIDLRQTSEYTFTTTGPLEGAERFAVWFTEKTTTGLPSATAADVQVFSYGAQVYIRASESSPGQVQVFDISGKQVWQQQVPLQAGLTTVQPQLVSGVYIIKVRTAQRQVTEKIVIQ